MILIKHKTLKLLINAGCDKQRVIDQLGEIEALAQKVNSFYIKLMDVPQEAFDLLEKEKQRLISKIGYQPIGVPFTNQDAELYALDRKLDYIELQLNADVEYERINIDIEKPLKTLAVRHVNKSNHKNLAKYIEHLIRKDLGVE